MKAIRITIVDGRGRTLHRLSKRSYFDAAMAHQKTEPWGAEGKPPSRKGLAHIEAGDKRPGGRRTPFPDGDYLPLPGGLPMRKDKVAPVLERVARALRLVDESGVVLTDNLNAATLTVADLRKYGSDIF